MERAGTLVISRPAEDKSGNQPYVVSFHSASVGEGAPSVRRCLGALALLRTLEALISDADVRFHALEQVRDEGHASIDDVVLSDAQVAKYGVGAPRRLGRFEATIGRPERGRQAEPNMRDRTEEVARFLNKNQGRPFCHTCLASSISIEFEDARKVVSALRIRREYGVGTCKCYVCRRHRLTIEASLMLV